MKRKRFYLKPLATCLSMLMFGASWAVAEPSCLIEGEESWKSKLNDQQGLVIEGGHVFPSGDEAFLQTTVLSSETKRKASSLEWR